GRAGRRRAWVPCRAPVGTAQPLRRMTGLRVLAVADSDSYLKWAAWSLARLRDDGGTPAVEPVAVVVRSPLAPTPEQARAAVAGTGLTTPAVLSPGAVGRLAATHRPDVVLIAATGP